MNTFVFIVGKLYIVVSSDTQSNAAVIAEKIAEQRLGYEFDSFNTIVELPAFGTAVITAA